MKDDTLIVTEGRDPKSNFGVVNPPVYHASTIIFPTLDALEESLSKPWEGVHYGRQGTPTTFALHDAMAALEGGARGIATSSGLAAASAALTAFVEAGDHVLVTDSVYGPTRRFCERMLRKFGVEVTFYDPLIGSDIARLLRTDTRVVFTESPGSLTFEVQDIPAIAAAAHAAGAVVINDNTWATPLYFKSFQHGVDVSVHAATKYIVGHADAMLGVIVTTEETYVPVKTAAALNGHCAGPDDVYLGLRGFRTLSVRLARHQESARRIAEWLTGRREVARVLYPALPDDPGHAIWKRDFLGASGLLGFILDRPYRREALAAMLDGMKLFAMGESWGGYESLLLPRNPTPLRTATSWSPPGPLLRAHVGLEDPDDLIADLEAGFARLEAAA
ncbi:MAG: cystathionine beta-lyase [Alphaproteobacteria bacterium]